MGVHPDAVDAAMPVDEGTRHRWQESVGRWMLELPASIQASLKPLVDGLNARVDAAIAALSMTTSQILSTVANPPASVAVTNNLSTGGTITAGTTISAGGRATFNAGITSTDVYSRLLTYGGGYISTYTHLDGTFGYVPSSRRFKQDIVDAVFDRSVMERLRLVMFRYIVAVETLGDDAPAELGLIAEEVDELGLHWLVDYDSEGAPLGVKYERLGLLLLGAAQDQQRQIDDLLHRVEALEGGSHG